MVTKVLVRVVPGGLQAINGVETAKLVDMHGKEVTAKLELSRNFRFHRKYFALLGVAHDMADTDLNAEQFRAFCTVGAGHCDFIRGENKANLIAIPRSISFAAMDELEFNRLYQDTLTFICKRWVLDENQLNQIVEFM